jgi:hypothetical protein
MTNLRIELNAEQHELLVRLLNSALKQKQVEVHRAEFSREFRNQLESEEAAIRELLDKLGRATAET